MTETGKDYSGNTHYLQYCSFKRTSNSTGIYKLKCKHCKLAYVEQELELQRVRDKSRTQGGLDILSQGKQVQAEINAQAEMTNK